MPGNIWKPILPIDPIGADGWVFTDEAGVQQDDVGAQDGRHHSQDLRVSGQLHHPGILKVNVVEAVLGVLFTWKHANVSRVHAFNIFNISPNSVSSSENAFLASFSSASVSTGRAERKPCGL